LPDHLNLQGKDPMRALVQRVTEAEVLVAGKSLGSIGQGVAVLVGVTHADTEREARFLAEKVAHLRIFDDEAGKLNRSLLDVNGSALVVSQFTLYGDARKGRRPSFIEAARPEQAAPLVSAFAEHLRSLGVPVVTGQFQAIMLVRIHNDGPVTIWLDTAELMSHVL
jgi:D-tyrosyl-tRNA(Tyr) deacylase